LIGIGSDLSVPALDGYEWMEEHLDGDGVVRFDRGEDCTVGVGGRFEFDDEQAGAHIRGREWPLSCILFNRLAPATSVFPTITASGVADSKTCNSGVRGDGSLERCPSSID
jgi:hypothetical protein